MPIKTYMAYTGVHRTVYQGRVHVYKNHLGNVYRNVFSIGELGAEVCLFGANCQSLGKWDTPQFRLETSLGSELWLYTHVKDSKQTSSFLQVSNWDILIWRSISVLVLWMFISILSFLLDNVTFIPHFFGQEL